MKITLLSVWLYKAFEFHLVCFCICGSDYGCKVMWHVWAHLSPKSCRRKQKESRGRQRPAAHHMGTSAWLGSLFLPQDPGPLLINHRTGWIIQPLFPTINRNLGFIPTESMATLSFHKTIEATAGCTTLAPESCWYKVYKLLNLCSAWSLLSNLSQLISSKISSVCIYCMELMSDLNSVFLVQFSIKLMWRNQLWPLNDQQLTTKNEYNRAQKLILAMTTKISTWTALFWKYMLISQVHLWILYKCILSISDKAWISFFFKKGTKNDLICSLFQINSCDLDLKERFDFYFHSHHTLTLQYEI